MTGVEKFVVLGVLSAAAGMAQITIGDTTSIVSIAWTILVAVVVMAATWGAVRARLQAVERTTEHLVETCATKESVEALEKRISDLVKLLGERRAS